MMRGGDRNSGQEAGGGSAGRCGGAGADGDEGQGRKEVVNKAYSISIKNELFPNGKFLKEK